MQLPAQPEVFSANVRLTLRAHGREYPLASTGPLYAILRNQVEIPACENAVLEMIIDGRVHRWEIAIEHDIVPFDQEFKYRVKRYPEYPQSAQ